MNMNIASLDIRQDLEGHNTQRDAVITSIANRIGQLSISIAEVLGECDRHIEPAQGPVRRAA